MSSTAIFAYILLFIVTTSGLLVLYGFTQPGFQATVNAPFQCLVNDNPETSCKFPIWNPPTPSNVTTALAQVPWWKCILSTPCVFATVAGSVGGSSTAQAIWNGFSIFGYGIGLFLQSMFVFLNKIGSALTFMNGLVTFLNNDSGVPFAGNIYVAFEILLAIFAVAILKPGGHGN